MLLGNRGFSRLKRLHGTSIALYPLYNPPLTVAYNPYPTKTIYIATVGGARSCFRGYINPKPAGSSSSSSDDLEEMLLNDMEKGAIRQHLYILAVIYACPEMFRLNQSTLCILHKWQVDV